MSGSKTRFGFAGGSDPPDAGETQSARTVYGHDVHLRLPAGFPAPEAPPPPTPVPPPPSWPPAARVRVPMSEQDSTNRLPVPQAPRPRRSRLARFLGRWTRSGRFESSHAWRAEDEVGVPRDPTGRNVLLVLLVAGLTFLITFAFVKLQQRMTAGTAPAAGIAPAAPAVAPAAPAAPLGAVPAPAVAAPAPVPAAPPAPTPAAPLPAAARGLGPLPAAPAARKPAPPPRLGAEPPPHLRNELLPLKP